MGSEPNLSAKWSVTIGTMINFDGDFDGHGHGDGMCKQVSTVGLVNTLYVNQFFMNRFLDTTSKFVTLKFRQKSIQKEFRYPFLGVSNSHGFCLAK